MDVITPDQIHAMPKEELAALNRKLGKKLALHMVGMLFLKLSIAGLTNVLTRKALIAASKHA